MCDVSTSLVDQTSSGKAATPPTNLPKLISVHFVWKIHNVSCHIGKRLDSVIDLPRLCSWWQKFSTSLLVRIYCPVNMFPHYRKLGFGGINVKCHNVRSILASPLITAQFSSSSLVVAAVALALSPSSHLPPSPPLCCCCLLLLPLCCLLLLVHFSH